MSAKILDGRKLSDEINKEIKVDLEKLRTKNIIPGLAVIIVGKDKASRLYVNNKKLACDRIGIKSEEYSFDISVDEKTIFNLIKELNHRDDIHGILVQLPLPKHIDCNKVIQTISPNKDVDAFHPVNVGKIMIGQSGFLPCTPQGILELINYEKIDLVGKECVIVGSSNIVGKPMSMLLVNKGATVTICNIFTQKLKKHCKRADILIVAVGKLKLITADMVKNGAVIIDVGMNRDLNGVLCGDVDFENVSKIAGYITPVPGGVGPMTISMLLKNTLYSAVKYSENF